MGADSGTLVSLSALFYLWCDVQNQFLLSSFTLRPSRPLRSGNFLFHRSAHAPIPRWRSSRCSGAPRMLRNIDYGKCLDPERYCRSCAYWPNPPQTALASSQHKAQKILNSASLNHCSDDALSVRSASSHCVHQASGRAVSVSSPRKNPSFVHDPLHRQYACRRVLSPALHERDKKRYSRLTVRIIMLISFPR